MKNPLRARAGKLIACEMAAFRAARSAKHLDEAWRALERAHIVSQPYLAQHLANYWAALTFAVQLRAWREVRGQLIRLAVAPFGALTGLIPIGNTGRAHVSAFQPKPVPENLGGGVGAQ